MFYSFLLLILTKEIVLGGFEPIAISENKKLKAVH